MLITFKFAGVVLISDVKDRADWLVNTAEAFTLDRRNLKPRLYIIHVAVRKHSSKRTSFISKRRFFVSVWMENVLKTERFETDDVSIIT